MHKRAWIGITVMLLLVTGCSQGNSDRTTQGISKNESESSKKEETEVTKTDPDITEVKDIPNFTFGVLTEDMQKEHYYNESLLDESCPSIYYLTNGYRNSNYEDVYYALNDPDYSKNQITCDEKEYTYVVDNNIYYASSGRSIGATLYGLVNEKVENEAEKEKSKNYNYLTNLVYNLDIDGEIESYGKYRVAGNDTEKKLVLNAEFKFDEESYDAVVVMIEDSTHQGIYIAGNKDGEMQKKEILAESVKITNEPSMFIENFKPVNTLIDDNGIQVTFELSDLYKMNSIIENPEMYSLQNGRDEYTAIDSYSGAVFRYICERKPISFPSDYKTRLLDSGFDKDSIISDKTEITDKDGDKWVRCISDSVFNGKAEGDSTAIYTLDKGDYILCIGASINNKKDYLTEEKVTSMIDATIQSLSKKTGESEEKDDSEYVLAFIAESKVRAKMKEEPYVTTEYTGAVENGTTECVEDIPEWNTESSEEQESSIQTGGGKKEKPKKKK